MTRPYAEVIGDPIAHSKSPLIHNFWLEKLGIEADYRTCHVRGEGLADYFAERRKDVLWQGCNVTFPHKQAALAMADQVDELAEAIGATNCLFRDGHGRLVATNTDVAGFLLPIRLSSLEGAHVVVIGAGGAARAVLSALKQRNVAFVTMLNRSVEKAAALLSLFGLDGEVLPLTSALPASCKLVVNASTLGMAGQDSLDLDLSALAPDSAVYDIVYVPLETPLLLNARALNLKAIDGIMMLVGQAAKAFELFYDEPAPQLDPALLGMLTR